MRWAGLALAVVAAVGVGAWVLWPDKGKKALRYAPADAIAVVHLEVADAWNVVEPFVKDAPEGTAQEWAEVRRGIGQCESVDVFVGMPNGKDPAGAMMVLKGDVDADFIRKSKGRPVATGNGRYDLTPRTPASLGSVTYRYIIGGEASDVPAGVILIGPRDYLTDARVAGLGKNVPPGLRKAVSAVQTGAPLWAAADGTKAPGSDFRYLVASVYFKEGKASVAQIDCRTTQQAHELSRTDIPEEIEAILGRVSVQRSGTTVTYRVPSVRPALEKARELIEEFLPSAGRPATLPGPIDPQDIP